MRRRCVWVSVASWVKKLLAGVVNDVVLACPDKGLEVLDSCRLLQFLSKASGKPKRSASAGARSPRGSSGGRRWPFLAAPCTVPRRAACLPKTDSTAESPLLRPRDGTQGTACVQINFCHPAAATTNGKAARYFEGRTSCRNPYML